MQKDRLATIVNAGASVSPLNLRTWLRSEMIRQSYSGHKHGGVSVYVFVTRVFVTALGAKKLHKIVRDAVDLHHWVLEAQVVTTEDPLTTQEAAYFLENMVDKRCAC